MRLEDQFRNPLPGETVTGTIIQGEATLLPAASPASPATSTTLTVTTDPAGLAAFRLRTGTSGESVVTEIRAAGLGKRAPESQFLSIVGLILPVGIAVEADGHLVVTDVGLQAVVRVDPRTGASHIISDATTGQGPTFDFVFHTPVAVRGRWAPHNSG